MKKKDLCSLSFFNRTVCLGMVHLSSDHLMLVVAARGIFPRIPKDWGMLNTCKRLVEIQKESESPAISRILILEGGSMFNSCGPYITSTTQHQISPNHPMFTSSFIPPRDGTRRVMTPPTPPFPPVPLYLSDSATGVRQRPGKAIAE